MGSFSLWHWIVVAVIVMLLFGGRGKISGLMGDFAQGIKAFKKGMSEDEAKVETPKESPMKTIDNTATPTNPSAANAENRKAV